LSLKKVDSLSHEAYTSLHRPRDRQIEVNIHSSSTLPQINTKAMATSGNQFKRPTSSQAHNDPKRLKRHYHHHHNLHEPVLLPAASEPAVQDEVLISHLMDRAVAGTLKEAGFDIADPAALSSLCGATEECMCCTSSVYSSN
jgi:hypothetical protein